jgi:hypothetical protein
MPQKDRYQHRLAATLVAAAVFSPAVVAAPTTETASFSRSSASPGTQVGLTYTNTDATSRAREVHLYLVESSESAERLSPIDRRLHFIGLIRHLRGRTRLAFTVPSLAAGRYAVASWCTTCPRRLIHILSPLNGRDSARASLLTVPNPSGSGCPTTRPNGLRNPLGPTPQHAHGNGVLWAQLPSDGTFASDPIKFPDGSFGTKMVWWAFTREQGAGLSVTIEDYFDNNDKYGASTVKGTSHSLRAETSWAARLYFPRIGCWRITGRTDDVTLTFVVAVT